MIAINNIAPTIAIAMMMATPMPRTYMSVGGKVTAGCAVGVGAAASTTKAVSACDGQYDSEPSKLAITVYLPSMSGVQSKL